jgi:adenine phosphoribosyltransferase
MADLNLQNLVADVTAVIRDVPDFPKPGILFKDITPVLADSKLFPRVLRWMAAQYKGEHIDRIVGVESRGFILGAAMVEELDAGFVPARKAGKLPWETVSVEYALEYGTGALQMHVDAIRPGQHVVIVDDLLATGGTALATVELVRRLGGHVVGCVFLVELAFLDGRKRLDVPVRALIQY